ncbi:MAG: DUF262 domain-containing protein [Chloroflexi bacterium]|nr:DUF262 domain-containing protein [Chloroflexota bacterium]
MTEVLEDHLDDNFVDDDKIEDESDKDDTVPPLRYDISSFGVDFDVEGVVRRVQRNEIFIPEWERSYVWNIRQASSFVESLLLGLPVPGIFLGRDTESGKLYVIDGQQRLKTLTYFFEQKFNPQGDAKKGRVFKLNRVHERFDGRTYDSLDERDRYNLNNSIIHATVVRQEDPPEDDTSMYEIFRRLNTGGLELHPQEIRCAIYQGELIDMVKSLNNYDQWRVIAGQPHRRLKDQELILRFMAMIDRGDQYEGPMSKFLNVFTQDFRHEGIPWQTEISERFKRTIDVFAESMGGEAFRITKGRVLNAAVFDSMTVGMARRLSDGLEIDLSTIKRIHADLLDDAEYLNSVSQSTSGEASVATRLNIATQKFAEA